jgi:hypothetical protein
MSGDEVDMTSNLLAVAEDMKMSVTLDGIDKDDLEKYIVKQLKENYHKPKRTSGRIADEKYSIPVGIFNLGNNTMFYKEIAPNDEEETDDTIEVHNYMKHVDGKLVMTDEEQTEDAEEELLKYNIAIKNDLPYQIYHKILHFGRLTIDELYKMYGAIEKEMFLLVVNNMINKRYLKKVKDVDRDIEFSPDETTNFNDAYKIVEREVETLECVGEEERKRVLA